jgi:hypothetical protein
MATTSTTVSAEIPEALRPFYTSENTGLIPRGIASIYPQTQEGLEASRAYYRDQYAPLINAGLAGSGGVAGMSQFQQMAGDRLLNMRLPDQFGMGTQAGQQATSGFQNLQNMQAMGVQAPELMMYQMQGPQQFGSEQAQQYMSPYMQNVVDIQQRQAIEAAQKAQLGQNLAAARQGTYGGARQALLQSEREGGLRTQLGDIQSKGLQSAYENAQAQFERDRGAQFQTGQQNLQAALGVQQLGAGQNLEAQRANQAAGLQAGQLQLGASQGLGSLAGTLGQLGTQQLAGQLDLTKTLGAYGDLQRGIEQQKMDAQRQFLTDQSVYGQTQADMLSRLLRGIPLNSQTQTQTTPPPSFASQLTGMGVAGLGLFNLLGGNK